MAMLIGRLGWCWSQMHAQCLTWLVNGKQSTEEVEAGVRGAWGIAMVLLEFRFLSHHRKQLYLSRLHIDGEDAVRAGGGLVHGCLTDGPICVAQEKLKAKAGRTKEEAWFMGATLMEKLQAKQAKQKSLVHGCFTHVAGCVAQTQVASRSSRSRQNKKNKGEAEEGHEGALEATIVILC
eukprot:1146490-Pelagomonas_calceolata.AAC.9